MGNIKNILFVCMGNTCRSVMAEALLKQFLREENIGSVKVSSAGISVLPYYRVFGVLLEVFEEEAIDVSGHCSTQINEALAKEADLILVMEERQRDYIAREFPGQEKKTFLLKEFAGFSGKDLEIEDPIGQSKQKYRETFEEIRECLERILKQLANNIKEELKP